MLMLRQFFSKRFFIVPFALILLSASVTDGTSMVNTAYASEADRLEERPEKSPEEGELIPLSPSFLERLFPRDEEQDPPTISRGDVCLIAPARPGEDISIWHQQPVFVWSGDIGGLTLTAIDPAASVSAIETETEVLWRHTPQRADLLSEDHAIYRVVYDGPSLRPGRRYRLKIYDIAETTTPITMPYFETLPFIQNWLIGNGLAANTTDAISRADYFARRGLPVDGIQAMFSAENPSPALIDFQAQLVQTICNHSDAAAVE